MNLSDVQFIFNRALSFTFSQKKNFLAFIILALCGLLVIFCRALSMNASQWIQLSLTFLPVFLCAGVLLSLGILLIRIYHDEIKQRPLRFRDIASNSWEVIIGASYFSIPIILCYLVLWMFLGLFVLLKEIPTLGDFFGVIFAFGPFLLNLGSIILGLLSIAMLFFITPILALNGLSRIRVSQLLVKRFKGDMFSNIFLATIALLPFLVYFAVLLFAAILTGSVCYACSNEMYALLQSFIIMIPFAALLAPAVVFFFNFAAEAHVLILKSMRV